MNIENLTVNTLRFLSVEAIQKAKSGHPGLPLGAAPAAFTLFAKQMKHNPKNPNFMDRDRFILSAGHGSSLLYSLFHVFGYGVTIDDLKNFRQLGSYTPGHPEYGITKGVEITTGPLGQGIANAVGMALAENHLAAEFNTEDFEIINHYTYALCGEGCLEEGVSSEACSLAGTLGLSKLIILYDCNNITIEGDSTVTFNEDILKRYEAYGFQTLEVEDGNDIEKINAAIEEAKADKERPSFIKINTKIGFGSPNHEGKASAHGAPLGEEEIKLTKKALKWEYKADFFVPKKVKEYIETLNVENEKVEKEWNKKLKAYFKKYPDKKAKWKTFFDETDLSKKLLNDTDFWTYEGNLATRASSEKVLQKIADMVPSLFGGSADLGPSNKSIMKNREYYSKENPMGSNMHFGIREFAMTAIANGMYVHGGVRPYIAGFFVFSDYMKAGLRLEALMQIPVISIFTHDSIGVGEDGPTHQPIEQLAALRSIPNYTVIRPCDTNETAAAWYLAITRKTSPTALVLSRQTLPLLEGTGKGAIKGAYILKEAKDKKNIDAIMIATGSEVSESLKALNILEEKGYSIRLVSMPSFEVFEEQTDAYKESVLPKAIRKRIAIEAASSFGWHKYIGLDGKMISMDTFGASAPSSKLFEKFGFTAENIAKETEELIKG